MATTSAPEPGGGRASRTAAAVTEQLYARHHRMVAGLCRALLRDAAEAEDAAQQAFLSAHRSLLNGAEPREPAAWLATIARNECWSRIRGRMREPLATDAADTLVGGRDPVAEAIRRADLAALWAAIEALPRTQRDALLLREFGGLRYDELAAALAVSESAVESLLVRARTRLRTHLKSAYAAFTGASWLDWLARLASGGAAPAAATKAVALGLGAAAVTGGAVVGPRVVGREHRPPPPPVTTTTAAAAPAPRQPAAAPVVAAVLTPTRTVAHRTAAPARRHVHHEQEGDLQAFVVVGGDGERSGDGGRQQERTREQEPARSDDHERGGGDRHGSPETTPGATVGDGSGERDHGGSETTTTAVTVTVETGEGDHGGDGEGGGDGGSSGPGGDSGGD